MQRRLKILPSFRDSRANAPSPVELTESPTLLYGVLLVTLLSYIHVALNELITPSGAVFTKCLPYKRDAAGVIIILLSTLLWIMALIQFRSVHLVHNIFSWIRASCFIYTGAFLNMSIKPSTWFLSFQLSDCYNNFGHDAIGRVGLTSYALILVGAFETLSLIAAKGECSNSYTVAVMCLHICLVVITALLIRA